MGFHRNRISKELALFQFAVTLLILATSVAAQPRACEDQCGDVSIPYPFGIGDGCSISSDFSIKCDTSNNEKPILATDEAEVVDISLDGTLRIKPPEMGFDCYNSSGSTDYLEPGMEFTKFYISNTRNTFTGIGCDTYAYISGTLGQNYSTGCVSFCSNIADVINGSCTGIGCCQTVIPRGVRSYKLDFSSYKRHQDILSFNPCSYGFVGEDGAYNFSTTELPSVDFMKKRFPIVIDWSIGNQTCIEAKKDQENYACKENSTCVDQENGPGYLCKCLDGYQGNPYLSNGCQDVNECSNPALNQCEKPEYCVNVVGNYTCKCPKNHHGDGRKDGEGCIRNQQVVQMALGISISSIAVSALSAWLYLLRKKSMFIKLKKKYFLQNGGLLLQQLTGRESDLTFTAEKLKKATDNYDESMVVGRGGFAIVYKGNMEGNNVVAVKRSKNRMDQGQVEQFINEVVVLSKIKHKNVVKLLGCCLEEEFPSLVYEFITNGTLFDHIHDKEKAIAMPWGTRLKIATETARVLSYLHSDASSTPIIHRDVKTTNILLDDTYTAKVSDFGASRLVPNDPTQLPTMVQGTPGYLDPEYLHTSQLNEKSDVYSFGVVLAELLTGRKALAFNRPDEEKSLAKYFVSSLKRGRLFDIVERQLVTEENRDEIMKLAKLAMRCLEIKGEDRPSMKDVVKELEEFMSTKKHPWVNVDLKSEETGKRSGGSSNNNSGVYDSHEMIFSLDNGR